MQKVRVSPNEIHTSLKLCHIFGCFFIIRIIKYYLCLENNNGNKRSHLSNSEFQVSSETKEAKQSSSKMTKCSLLLKIIYLSDVSDELFFRMMIEG